MSSQLCSRGQSGREQEGPLRDTQGGVANSLPPPTAVCGPHRTRWNTQNIVKTEGNVFQEASRKQSCQKKPLWVGPAQPWAKEVCAASESPGSGRGGPVALGAIRRATVAGK